MSEHQELTEAEKAVLKAEILKEGSSLEKVSKECGASEFCLAKAVAGLRCPKTTIALARYFVAKQG